MKLSREQYEKVKHIEAELLTAYKSQFIRNTNTVDFEIVSDIWKEVSGDTEYYKIQCSSCVINLYSRLGRLVDLYLTSLSNKVKDEKKKSR